MLLNTSNFHKVKKRKFRCVITLSQLVKLDELLLKARYTFLVHKKIPAENRLGFLLSVYIKK